jgi:hypothetical protein
MQALPNTYKNTEAENGTVLKFTITTEAGGDWYLKKTEKEWVLVQEAAAVYRAEVVIPGETAWLIFSKGMDRKNAGKQIKMTGDQRMGEIVLNMVSVMA